MWDDEVNSKIKEAADQYHPAYDDSAWGKMEELLDQHLPQKKDRRRFFYFIPLIMVAAGILFFIVFKKEASSSKIAEQKPVKSSSEKIQSQNLPADKEVVQTKSVKPSKNLPAKDIKKKNELPGETDADASDEASGNKTSKLSERDNIRPLKKKGQLSSNNTAATATAETYEDKSFSNKAVKENIPGSELANDGTNKPAVQQESTVKNSEIVSGATAGSTGTSKSPGTTGVSDSSTTVTAGTTNKQDISKPKDVAKTTDAKVLKNDEGKIKGKKSFMQNFGIGLSLGPDASGVTIGNTGKITFTYGAQLRYSFNNRFTLRTGFYVARKIYSADDNEYHVPQGTSWNAYLKDVDANCKVYEVPVTISYNFGKSKNHTWFASGGLSSYFMKTESYVYNYKNDPVNGNYSKDWSIKNQNKHYFSVLDISGGYEYYINKRFSLSAEPYLKIPLSGIGAGKIKLNSTGALFTVTLKPF